MNHDLVCVTKHLDEQKIPYQQDFELRDSVSFRLPCRAALAVFPKAVTHLTAALGLLREYEIPYVLMGKGSNLFFADEVYRGAVIFTDGFSAVERRGNELYAECGVSLSALARRAAEEGLAGLEFAYGIPGSVGGAVYMNAGAFGGSVSDCLIASVSCDPMGNITECTDHRFDYRHSIYMEDRTRICLGARFGLTEKPSEQIFATMREYLQQRREKQPLEYPSAGSYFKRPEGHFAGKLIEECGLKGLRVGGAQVSEKHAGFLINRENAKPGDVLALEEKVKEAVYCRFGVVLEREVCVIENA